jgi:cytochrome c oxidase assembly protein subunit 15
MGIHGLIEFGNRTLTGVLGIIALLTIISASRIAKAKRKGVLGPAIGLLGLIVLQAVVGGITVWTGLNPWIVGSHFVISGVMIALATTLVWHVYRPAHQAIPYTVYRLTWPITVVGWLTVIVGILVTGAGPHSGDVKAGRNGLDLELWQHLHSYPAYLFLALQLISLLSLLKHDASSKLSKWRLQTKIYLILVIVTIGQAVVGVAQSRLGVPAGLVALHMFGAATIVSLVTFQWLSVRGKSNLLDR